MQNCMKVWKQIAFSIPLWKIEMIIPVLKFLYSFYIEFIIILRLLLLQPWCSWIQVVCKFNIWLINIVFKTYNTKWFIFKVIPNTAWVFIIRTLTVHLVRFDSWDVWLCTWWNYLRLPSRTVHTTSATKNEHESYSIQATFLSTSSLTRKH